VFVTDEENATESNEMPRHTYLIGEIGQNHNGSCDIAKLIIDLIARPAEDPVFGITLPHIDAVKLTKRDLDFELAASQKSSPYTGRHSFGPTYGAHREFLELSNRDHFEIYQYAKEQHLDFVETICAPSCLSLLELFAPDYLKVASRDLTNPPLLEALAKTHLPIILSTGMAGRRELDDALELITKHHSDISILHCVSQYPAHPSNVNLQSIQYLRENYSQYRIGYSDHTVGISIPVAAAAMGAEIIEKHITIDRRMKGSDHLCSLGPDGVQRMTRDIRLLDVSMGERNMRLAEGIESARIKLERSIASIRDIREGEMITERDIHLLSPGDGFRWSDRARVVGNVASSDIPKDELIYPRMLAQTASAKG
jgi:sialic acid synthase